MKRNLLVCSSLLLAFACLEGGSNLNGQRSGNREGGIQLWLGDIAVDADGRYFLSRSEDHLVVGDLQLGSLSVIDEIPVPEVLVFRPDRTAGFYAVHVEVDQDGTPRETVTSFDLDRRAILWEKRLTRWDFTMDVTKDGDRLVLTSGDSILVLDTDDGLQIAEVTLEHPAVDVDLLSDGRIVAMEQRTFDANNLPEARVSVWSSADGSAICETTIDNCDSELVVTQDSARAFIAPTRCGRDPISVVDLDSCTYRGNLPGFGPVALSPDGDTVVGFADRDANDPTAPPLPQSVLESDDRYHLMFVDVESLDYDTTAIGDLLPRYAFTPNGATLIVDHDVDRNQSRPGPVVLVDVDDRTLREVVGPEVEMNHFALTPDSSRAFVVDLGLFELDIEEALTKRVPLSFDPASVNITPRGETLLLKDAVYGRVHLFDIASEEEGATLSL
ncbi:MAG: hypothetical protein RMA76_13650 [Deltaproteobacteria bacterium]|jgi:hypothetical protein